LRTRGFAFVDRTMVYATMPAIGVVDDRLLGCYRGRVTG